MNAAGQQVAFDLRVGLPARYTPIWPPPEVLANVQNVIGYTPAQAAAAGTTGVIAENGQIGNLGLTASPGGRRRPLPADPQRLLHQAQPRPQPRPPLRRPLRSRCPVMTRSGTRLARVPADRSSPSRNPRHQPSQ